MRKYCLIISLILLAVACKTPLCLSDISGARDFVIVDSLEHKLNCTDKIEYIGVKNSLQKNNKLVKFLGDKLENQGLALNTQGLYSRTINIDELPKYHSKCKYVTYLDFSKLKYACDEYVDYNEGLQIGGWLVAGLTIFTLFPVYVPMLCCADKNTCQIDLIVEGNIVIYDTEKQEIIKTVPLSINRSDHLNGKYNNKNTDQLAIDGFYRSLFEKTVFDGYSTLSEL